MVGLGHPFVDGGGQLLFLPSAKAVRADEEKSRRALLHALKKVALPRLSGREHPTIEPDLESQTLEICGDLLHHGAFLAGVTEEDIVIRH